MKDNKHNKFNEQETISEHEIFLEDKNYRKMRRDKNLKKKREKRLRKEDKWN